MADLKRWRLITWVRRGSTSNLYAILGYKDNVIPDAHSDDVIAGAQKTCAEAHIKCDPTDTRSRSNDPDPLNEIWIMVLAELAMIVGKGTFSMRYKHTRLVSLNDTNAEVACGDNLIWFQKQGRPLIERHLSAVAGRDVSVVFV